MAGIARMRTIVLDCPDPQVLARFYGELLGWEVTYADDDWVNLAGPGGKLSFQLASDYVAPTWPRSEGAAAVPRGRDGRRRRCGRASRAGAGRDED